MEVFPRFRTDALLHWAEYEKQVESDSDPLRRAFYSFIASQSLYAVSKLDDDVTLDMRAIAALAERLLLQQKRMLGILSGEIGEEDWSE